MKKLLIFLCIFFSISSISRAQDITREEAIAWGNDKGNEIINLLSKGAENKFEKLDNLIINDIDIPYIAKFVTGKYWNLFTEEQKTRYLEMFQRYLLGIYKTFPLEFDPSEIKFHIEDIKSGTNHTDIVVPLEINGESLLTEKEGGPLYVSFRIHRKDNCIKLIDLKVAESSLLMAYRNKIYELIQKDEEEIDWFLEDFETWIPNKQE